MLPKTSFTFVLSEAQQRALEGLLADGNYLPVTVPHTRVAAKTPDYSVHLYTSGKCLVQGKGAEEFVTFILEPVVLQRAGVGYEEVLSPERFSPHMGVDESGKGDFFGPLVIAAAYVDAESARALREMQVRDSKTIHSDQKAMDMGRAIRQRIPGRFSVVRIGPAAYNRLYAKMRNVNTLLSWGHARAIENLLDLVPTCPRALSDQFGRKDQVERALMRKGREIVLEQRPRAESDIAVAAASILAREAFLFALRDLKARFGVTVPKGSSGATGEVARDLVRQHGPALLLEVAKCHFKTADQVLQAAGSSRAALGPDGQAVSKPMGPGGFVRRGKRKEPKPDGAER